MPDISLGVFVALGEKGDDRIRQFAHRGETLLSDVVGQVAKEALHQVEPRRRARSKVHVEARVLGEPSLHFVMLMRRVIVGDQLDVETAGVSRSMVLRKASHSW